MRHPTAWCWRVLYELIFEGRVHPRLPAWPVGPEGCKNLWVEPDRNLFFDRVHISATGFSHDAKRRGNSAAW